MKKGPKRTQAASVHRYNNITKSGSDYRPGEVELDLRRGVDEDDRRRRGRRRWRRGAIRRRRRGGGGCLEDAGVDDGRRPVAECARDVDVAGVGQPQVGLVVAETDVEEDAARTAAGRRRGGGVVVGRRAAAAAAALAVGRSPAVDD